MSDVLLSCPIMAGLCQRHGPVRLSQQPAFESLADAIISQQISGRAAEAIMNRLRDRLPVEPEPLAKANVRTLRAAGLSRAKTVYLRELARFATAGGLDGIESLPDAEVVERLTSVKGIGAWTAEMFLIFSLNRPDVWPVGDGGIQRAALNLYRIRSPRSLQKLGERFRPVRTHAAWYLWRSLDEA